MITWEGMTMMMQCRSLLSTNVFRTRASLTRYRDHSDDDGSDDDDEEEDQDEDEDGDNDEDEDEDEDQEDDDDHSDDEGAADGEDVDMGESTNGADTRPTPKTTEVPPYLRRRRELVPSYPESFSTLALDAVVGISLPSAVHSLATTMCSSYLLTGSQDGHIRAYDLWSSVNGGQLMTAQQRSVVGLGESINKAGVSRGWWNNEVFDPGEGEGDEGWRSLEPVYSLACESDGLWAAAGTRVSGFLASQIDGRLPY
jgi:transcriptional activator SPT8